MKRRTVFLIGIAVCALLIAVSAYLRLLPGGPVPAGAPTPPPSGPEWIDPLDQSNVFAWRNITDDLEIFDIHDGILHIPGNSIYPLRYVAYTAEKFGDFEFHVEYKVASRANSGIFLRAASDDPLNRGFEIQVLDDFGEAPTKHTSGAVYDVVTPMFNMSLPAGEWNSFDIRMEGPRLTVVMNGWLVVSVDLDRMTEPLGKFELPYAQLPREGMIMFQDHGGEVWYRNLRVRGIPGPAASPGTPFAP